MTIYGVLSLEMPKRIKRHLKKEIEETRKLFRKLISWSINVVFHILMCETTKQAWDALENAFEDKGLNRRVGLLPMFREVGKFCFNGSLC